MKFYLLFSTTALLYVSTGMYFTNAEELVVKKTQETSLNKQIKNKTANVTKKNANINASKTKQKNSKIENKIFKKKNNNPKTSNIYKISERTIDVNSPMCQYAAKNDVISLRKVLAMKNYKISDVNTICKNNESLFLIAVKNDNFITAKFLLDNDADINLQNEAGVSALHIVARSNNVNTDRIFDLLIHSKKLDVNIKDTEGYTPLMRAVEFEKLSVIKSLIKHGAVLDVKNNYGKNALDLAQLALDGKKDSEERKISENIIDILITAKNLSND